MSVRKAVDLLVGESEVDSKIHGPVFLGIKFESPPISRPQYQPTLIVLPHRMRRTDETTTCLVVQDSDVAAGETLSRSRNSEGLFDEVLTLKKLRRRVIGRKAGSSTKGAERFFKSFTAVFVQKAALSELIEVLGRDYYKRPRHLPISVNVEAPFEAEQTLIDLKHTLKSTQRVVQLVLKPEGLYASMRVGHTKMGAAKLAENTEAAIAAVRQRAPGGLGETADFNIKTPESLTLSI